MKNKIILLIFSVVVICAGVTTVSAQDVTSLRYVPLIGISMVSDPAALPGGPGSVTYRYAVKNFLKEVPLSNVQVTDDKCSTVVFVEGDDNSDMKLDHNETWRYSCKTTLSTTTQSVATAVGTVGDLSATHKAYGTVVVGSSEAYPLVNIINITKVAYPLALPQGGGDITFTYRVNNPGVVSLSNVSVVDDKCKAMSGKLGDINVNNLLDTNEVWVYTCTTHLIETTTNTVGVTAFSGRLKAVGYATITVTVALDGGSTDATSTQMVPGFSQADDGVSLKITVWITILSVLVALYVLRRYVIKT